ncbi:MAG: hypothetical protein JWO61_202 [Candidatus Saccharibacteria bacterium]|nr:hypothetical protein [Candidatus Saccharibacteria bacterium]
MSEYKPSHRAELTEDEEVDQAILYLKDYLSPEPELGCTGGFDHSAPPARGSALSAHHEITSVYGEHIASRAIIGYYNLPTKIKN